jgi:gas vesicle protein
MAAAMYGMSLVAMTALLPALTAINAKLIEAGVAAGFASGGLTLLLGAMSMLAAYAGFEFIFKPLFGDKLKSDLLDITNINHELNDTVSILSDLSGAAGDTPILNGLYGETTFNDLKQNAELTDTTLEDLQSRLATMREEQAAASTAGDTELAAGLQASINLLTKAEDQILAIDRAQTIVTKGAGALGDSYASLLNVKADGFAGALNDASILVSSGLINNKQYAVGGKKNGETFYREFGKGKAGKEAAERFIAEFDSTISGLSNESSEFMQDYYTDLLSVQSDANDQFITEEQELYNAITQQQHEFANAREELFFGERQNFTGALYKQVVQGGVESLLHKTEIVQHNVFNGYNTEQMVDRVTRGVLDELRAQGVGA